ncbi:MULTISPECIES: hypothetical protein [Pseudomonas]|uniref:hypothetical protein n=1 Tax=Pseudomonas TaxID=286 RepID=UPI000231FD27|nr:MULTISPECIES: hypothetical protein [Pseudomonas]EHF11206.1 hypothetical protein HMPREF1030_04924 [Pseudomonas aeruginosa]QKQ57977.1 hypothetical protein FOC67_02060 [Pseudomonas sp. FDAARGOS_761]
MSTSCIQALASTWAQLAKEVGFPADYDGTSTPETHRACGVIQEWIREHIVATNDMRLFGLLHLLGQASLRMEQALWPDDYARMIREVAEALREVEYPNSKSYTQEEVMQAMQERINRRLGKSA